MKKCGIAVLLVAHVVSAALVVRTSTSGCEPATGVSVSNIKKHEVDCGWVNNYGLGGYQLAQSSCTGNNMAFQGHCEPSLQQTDCESFTSSCQKITSLNHLTAIVVKCSYPKSIREWHYSSCGTDKLKAVFTCCTYRSASLGRASPTSDTYATSCATLSGSLDGLSALPVKCPDSRPLLSMVRMQSCSGGTKRMSYSCRYASLPKETPAPPTGVPPTAAPVTPAPPTGVPPTPFPPTPAPLTPAPLTLAPPTPFPPTPVPLTPAPDTPAPPTTAPQTLVPATQAPVTSAPATTAPATTAPATTAPATTAPATSAPATTAPATSAPATTAPATTAPATSAPATSAPATTAPATPSPATPAPETAAPRTVAPQTVAPLTYAPGTHPPATQAPSTSAPATDAPATPVPLTGAPATNSPASEAPDTSSPETSAPVTGVPATMAPSTSVPLTSSPVTDPPNTGSPSTNAPLTSAPNTATPPTVAPATNPPKTSSPATDAPVTFVPTTAAPITAPPDTLAPNTSAPDTDVPSTNAPPEKEVLVKKNTTLEVETKEMEAAGEAVLVGSVVGTSAATSATRLILVSQSCDVQGSDRIPRALHPTQLKISGSIAMGAVVSNLLLIIITAVATYGLLMLVTNVGPSWLIKERDLQGFFRLPSIPLFVFQWLYQGSTLGGVMLVMYPQNVFEFIIGMLNTAWCMAVPLWIFGKIKRGVPREAKYMEESRGSVFKFIAGPGEWVSLKREMHFVYRYASVLRMYREDVAWFSLIEFAGSFALSACAALRTDTDTQCGHIRLFSALIFFMLLVLETALWPHVRPRDNYIDILILSFQTIGLLFMASAFYSHSTGGWNGVLLQSVLYGTLVVMLGKVFLDACTELYIFAKGKRMVLQEKIWGEAEKAALLPTEVNGLDDGLASLAEADEADIHLETLSCCYSRATSPQSMSPVPSGKADIFTPEAPVLSPFFEGVGVSAGRGRRASHVPVSGFDFTRSPETPTLFQGRMSRNRTRQSSLQPSVRTPITPPSRRRATNPSPLILDADVRMAVEAGRVSRLSSSPIPTTQDTTFTRTVT